MAEEYPGQHRLHDAIENDSVDDLHNLIVDEPELLDGLSHTFPHTPLHIAAAAGKTNVVMELAILKPSFATKLNPMGYSPMHLALQNQHYDTAKSLMTMNPNLIRVGGRDGITPLHYVAGKVGENELELLAEFLCTCASSIEDLTSRCETAVHVAVRKLNLEALKVLLAWLERVDRTNILYWKDIDGKTALSIATPQPPKPQPLPSPLLPPPSLLLSPPPQLPQPQPSPPQSQLQPPPLLPPPQLPQPQPSPLLSPPQLPQPQPQPSPPQSQPPPQLPQPQPSPPPPPPTPSQLISQMFDLLKSRAPPIDDDRSLSQLLQTEPILSENSETSFELRCDSARNIIFMVATFVATATYQAGLTPPGGYWQDDSSNSTVVTANSSGLAVEKPHQAGKTILSGSDLYAFTFLNSMVFVTSILTIWITSIPLLPHTVPVHGLVFFLGTAYFSAVTTGFPKSDTKTVNYYVVVLLPMILLFGGLMVPGVLWIKNIRFRRRVDAPARHLRNFPGWKDGK